MATCNAAIDTTEFMCPQPCDPATLCKFGTDVFHLADGQANVPLNCLAEELPGSSFDCSADNCHWSKLGLSDLTKATCALAIYVLLFHEGHFCESEGPFMLPSVPLLFSRLLLY
jgi:hypothetical protein